MAKSGLVCINLVWLVRFGLVKPNNNLASLFGLVWFGQTNQKERKNGLKYKVAAQLKMAHRRCVTTYVNVYQYKVYIT